MSVDNCFAAEKMPNIWLSNSLFPPNDIFKALTDIHTKNNVHENESIPIDMGTRTRKESKAMMNQFNNQIGDHWPAK